jgi:hypothetical protein
MTILAFDDVHARRRDERGSSKVENRPGDFVGRSFPHAGFVSAGWTRDSDSHRLFSKVDVLRRQAALKHAARRTAVQLRAHVQFITRPPVRCSPPHVAHGVNVSPTV